MACMSAEIYDKLLCHEGCNEAIVVYRGSKTWSQRSRTFALSATSLPLGLLVEGKPICGYRGLEMCCDGKTIVMTDRREQRPPLAKPTHDPGFGRCSLTKWRILAHD